MKEFSREKWASYGKDFLGIVFFIFLVSCTYEGCVSIYYEEFQGNINHMAMATKMIICVETPELIER
jgi:hypothetical protein